jgi:hypothetical protein
LPHLATLRIDNVDDFSKDSFNVVFGNLANYTGLETLSIELTPFDVEEVKE